MMALQRACERAAEVVASASGLAYVIAHHDADGICSAAIIAKALASKHRRAVIVITDVLQPTIVEHVIKARPAVIWLADIGLSSGNLEMLHKLAGLKVPVVVTDHHPVNTIELGEHCHVLNCNLYGVDGLTEACGATLTYMVAKHLVTDTAPIIPLAVVAMAGDKQLDVCAKGLNAAVIQEGESKNIIGRQVGIKMYGRSSLPLDYALAYTTNFDISGFSGNLGAVRDFLGKIGVRLINPDGTTRTYVQLSDAEREKLIEELVILMSEAGLTLDQITACFGEYYTLKIHPPTTPLYFADEYATLLNACSRGVGRLDVALALAANPTQKCLEEALALHEQYRQELKSIFARFREGGLIYLSHVVYAVLPEGTSPRTTGAVATMLSGSDMLKGRPCVVILCPDMQSNTYKVSLRAIETSGVNVGKIAETIAKSIEGSYGGGHAVAAGISLPMSVNVHDIASTINEMVKQATESKSI